MCRLTNAYAEANDLWFLKAMRSLDINGIGCHNSMQSHDHILNLKFHFHWFMGLWPVCNYNNNLKC